MRERSRVLLIGDRPNSWPEGPLASDEVLHAADWQTASEVLLHQAPKLLIANLEEAGLLDGLRTLLRARVLLDHAVDGIAVVDFDLHIRWANPTFQRWCDADPVGRGFYEALGGLETTDLDFCPFQSALASQSTARPDEHDPVCVTARLACRAGRHIELHVTPLAGSDPGAPLFLALAHDVTALVQQQHKLDALYRAGRELAALAPEHLEDLSVSERVELLKRNIRRLTRELLHFEMIEIRILDPVTGRLDILLQDGMTGEAIGRELFARPDGQGVTGFVATTGASYLCPDTEQDPLYLPGALGARSSLTVPLRCADRIVGTFNVESPQTGAFGTEDLQFAEIFSHAVASALNTLELLRAEKTSGASQSIEAVNREVSLPVDDILGDATWLLERYIGHEPEAADRIRMVLRNARQIKQSILKVGEDLVPRPLPSTLREPSLPVLKGIRVLVADNDDRVRRSAHQLIGRWGGIVETARDGQEALTMARLTGYDVIVADIRLPDLSGFDVYRALREASPKARVILMTGFGYDPGHSLVRARQEGLRHVLYKPFRVDQLRDALVNLRSAPNRDSG